MSHFFLWIGRDPEHRLELARAQLTASLSRRPDATLVSEWFSLVAYGSERSPAWISTIAREGTTIRALVRFGHAWPRSGEDFRNSRPIENAAPGAEARSLRERFDGIYGFASVDGARGHVAVASDLLGSFHLYWRSLTDGLAVSTSPSLLVRIAPANLDPIGVQEFVGASSANEDRSLWEGIRKLRGSQILLVDRECRWMIEHHRPLIALLQNPTRNLQDSLAALDESIGGVLDRLTSCGRPIVDVTGGNDSRALAAALVAHGHAFTSTVTGEPNSDDVRISAKLASIGGWSHEPRAPPEPPSFGSLLAALSLTDGEFDAFEFSGIAEVHRTHMRGDFDLSLNGSYGETGRGYPWRLGLKGLVFGDLLSRRLLSRQSIDIEREGACRFHPSNGHLFPNPIRLDWPAHGASMIRRLADAYPGLPQCAYLDLIHIDLRMERWQGRIASCTNHLWPAVSPWGFQDSLSVLLTAHPCARRNSLLTRAYTASAAPRVAREPLFTGNPAMPFSWGDVHRFVGSGAYYIGRARAKLGFGRPGSGTKSRPMLERYVSTFQDSPILGYLKEPMLSETGLFENGALLVALDPARPMNESEAATWCRLATLEILLRELAKSVRVAPPAGV